jgi:dipeptidyl aminopeptidase/acylaminoacyl peptidase
VSVQNAQTPQDVYVYDIEPVTGDAAALPTITLARWTQSELGAIAGSPVTAQLVEFPTWDRSGNRQRLLPAFVFKPRTPGPHPVIIDMHGGPESQYRSQWNAFTQYLVNELGYAVVAPNVRGSAGYGRSFMKLDDGALREDPVRDIGALLVWIGLQPDFDRKRIAVIDDSPGGYLALASLANYGDRLAGGIVRNILPLSNATSIRKPLLIAQGLGDPRMPVSESQLMTARLRGNGGEVWYLAAKDEGRDFNSKASRDEYLATVAAFLQHIAP